MPMMVCVFNPVFYCSVTRMNLKTLLVTGDLSCLNSSPGTLLRQRECGEMLLNNTHSLGEPLIYIWCRGVCVCVCVCMCEYHYYIVKLLYSVWKNKVMFTVLSSRLSEPENPSVINTLFRRGTSFRYSGRTYKQIPRDRKAQPQSVDGASRDPKCRPFAIKVRLSGLYIVTSSVVKTRVW